MLLILFLIASPLIFRQTKDNQKAKFAFLQKESRRHHYKQLDRSKVVVNLSQRKLTKGEETLLALGLNFALTPKELPCDKIIASTKSLAR